MFGRGIDYLCDVFDGKKSIDWPFLFLVAFMALGSIVAIHGCLFDATTRANSLGSGVRYIVETVSGSQHCYAITQEDEYGGYTYQVDCKTGRFIAPLL
jgi:hypothetical protein